MTKIQTHANFTIETNKTVNHDYWYQSTFYAPKGSTQSTDKIGHLIDISTARIDTSNTQMVKIIPHTMFEVIDSKISTVIKPYFDFDLKLPKGTKNDENKIENAYKACKKGILELIPDVNWKDVAIAERHGYSSIHECEKISWRFFVNNIKTNMETLQSLCKIFPTNPLQNGETLFDTNCYHTHQKMGMVDGCKGYVKNKDGIFTNDDRILIASDKNNKKIKNNKAAFVIQYVESNWPLLTLQKPPEKKKSLNNIDNAQDSGEVKKLVDCLSMQRADDERTWVEVGWCLRNIQGIDQNNALQLWIEFSKKSDKFVPGECEQKWKHFRDEGYNIGSLHLWAKQDDPSEYSKIITARVKDDLENVTEPTTRLQKSCTIC